MSLNGYSYVHGNPIMHTDPSGELSTLAITIAARGISLLFPAVAFAVIMSLLLYFLLTLDLTAAVEAVRDELRSREREQDKACDIPELQDPDRRNQTQA